MQSVRAPSDHVEGGLSSGRARSAPGGGTECNQKHTGVRGGPAFTAEQTSALRGKHRYQGACHHEITDKPHQPPVNGTALSLLGLPTNVSLHRPRNAPLSSELSETRRFIWMRSPNEDT